MSRLEANSLLVHQRILAKSVLSRSVNLEDYRWLVSSAAEPYLQRIACSNEPLVRQTTLLRKELSLERTHLILEQVELRRRARIKFRSADTMFFTPLGLEQATDEVTAQYKSSRFGSALVYDLCCGVGGDLLSLAQRGPSIGVDRNPIVALLAEKNLQTLEVGEDSLATRGHQVLCAATADIMPGSADYWHLDPDRRPGGQRTTNIAGHEPGPEEIDRLLRSSRNGSIKLAPAATLPSDWPPQAELEWIGRQRECKQLVVWCGDLARKPGVRCATILTGSGISRTVSGDAIEQVPIAPKMGRYVYEPHAAVLAAGLAGVLATDHGLAAVAPGIAYLTGEQLLSDPAIAEFEVLDVLPLDVRKLKQLVAHHRMARLEVKKRGVAIEPSQLQRKLRCAGDEAGVLLVYAVGSTVTVVLARRPTAERA